MYAIANLLEEGKLKDATAVSMKLARARGQLDTTLYTNASRDSISRLNPLLPVALRTGNWRQVIELLKTSEPPAEQTNLVFLARTLAEFATGMQAAEAQDVLKAEESSVRLDAQPLGTIAAGERWRGRSTKRDKRTFRHPKATTDARRAATAAHQQLVRDVAGTSRFAGGIEQTRR